MMLFITTTAADFALGTALAECRMLGASVFGFVLDAETHWDRPRGAAAGAPAWNAPVPMQLVKRGDDLTQMIEGWNYAHR
jgi:hypothetical protein